MELKYAPDRRDDIEGVLPLLAEYTDGDGSADGVCPLIFKARTKSGLARGFFPFVIEDVGLELPKPYFDYRTACELDGAPTKEIEVYRLQHSVPELRRYLPRYVADHVDDERNEYALLIEMVPEPHLMDRYIDLSGWTLEFVGTALDAIGEIHGRWYGRDAELENFGWLGPRIEAADVVADEDLWSALLEFGREHHPALVDPRAYGRRRRIIETASEWHGSKDQMAHTLAHDDFSPRNVCYRALGAGTGPSPVIYDWELTQIDIPQRDLVEMLTFTVTPETSDDTVAALVERHRASVEHASGVRINRAEWREGVRCEIMLEAINRLALHVLMLEKFEQGFETRINAAVERLLDIYA
ncbi:MAG: hypothetical protein GY850_08240 [bacterium]|nr:hypothetical protein [bacterium]